MKKRILCLISAVIFVVCVFSACEKEKSDVGYSSLSFTDIYGEQYSNIFSKNKLTVVNLFATWCSPCVREIPELQKLSDELSKQNIAVVGIVTDAYANGQIDTDIVEAAKKIADTSGADYPFLIPDETYFKGYITSMQAFPETLFIDSDGKIVYSSVGSNSYENWLEITQKAVDMLEN